MQKSINLGLYGLVLSLFFVINTYAAKEKLETEDVTKIQVLPPEILGYAFSFLETKEIIHSVQHVNKQFKEAAEDPQMWKAKIEQDFKLNWGKLELYKHSSLSKEASLLIKFTKIGYIYDTLNFLEGSDYKTRKSYAFANLLCSLMHNNAKRISDMGYGKETYKLLAAHNKIDSEYEFNKAAMRCCQISDVMPGAGTTLEFFSIGVGLTLLDVPYLGYSLTLGSFLLHPLASVYYNYTYIQAMENWSPKATLKLLQEMSQLSEEEIKRFNPEP